MRRFLLKDEVSRSQAEAHFQLLGWECIDRDDTSDEVIDYKSSWTDTREGVANYLENSPLDCTYVLCTDAEFEALAQSFEQAGLRLTRDDVLATSLATGSDADALRTIGRLGLLGHGPLDTKVVAKLTALLIQPNPRWQRFALYALSNTSWSPLGTVVDEAIAGGAFDDDLAEGAKGVLAELRASNWNEAFYAE